MIQRDKILYYKKGYKYQTSRDFRLKIGIIPSEAVDTGFIILDKTGFMIIKKDYAWDGASGPTWDTKDSMVGSLVHDAGYQLLRLRLIDIGYKEYLDKLLHDLCTEDGMISFRADYWRWAVLNFGRGSTRPSDEPQELMAP